MKLHDPVFGPLEITEPVLLDLLGSSTLHRLSGVYQGGVLSVLGMGVPFTRLDHSIGVLLLLRRLGASLEEQIAGLLHDVGHTTFSHVADYLFGDGYHEQQWERVLLESEIPGILARYGMNWRNLNAETGQWGLLEQPTPQLCADRIDNFLRCIEPFGLGTSSTVAWLLDGITVADGELAISDLERGRWIGQQFMLMDRRHWVSVRDVTIYLLFAEVLQQGLTSGVLQESQFYSDSDRAMWQRLQEADDPEIQRRLALLTPQLEIAVLKRTDQARAHYHALRRPRRVDPLVQGHLGWKRLSAYDSAFADELAQHLQDHQEVIHVYLPGLDYAPIA
jgi:uncharacterized protein